jgi:hypothetical protein
MERVNMSKSLWDIEQEIQSKLPKRNYGDFPVGTYVEIISKCVDFYFFYGEKGTVRKNTGRYLGIIVEFDEPRCFVGGMIQKDFGFEPHNLIVINKSKKKYCNYCGHELVS